MRRQVALLSLPLHFAIRENPNHLCVKQVRACAHACKCAGAVWLRAWGRRDERVVAGRCGWVLGLLVHACVNVRVRARVRVCIPA